MDISPDAAKYLAACHNDRSVRDRINARFGRIIHALLLAVPSRLHAAEPRRQTGFLRVCTTGPSEQCEPMWQASIATDILPIVTADSGEGCGRALGGCTEGPLRL